jgi:hypothetical protein
MTLQEQMEIAIAEKNRIRNEKNLANEVLGKVYAKFRRIDEELNKAFVEIYRLQALIDEEKNHE